MEGILIENVHKCYTIQNKTTFKALSGINLHISPGEFVSLIGESGSGKSTLARIILGLEKPSIGEIIIDGENIEELKKSDSKLIYKKMQAVFQDAGGTLNPGLSVYHNVEESLVNLTKLNFRQRKERILELMFVVGMKKELLKIGTGQLSGGEQRRLSLLRALTVQPKYIILDEVISGLDFIAKNAVEKLLLSYRKNYSCGYIFITHDKPSAYRLSDRIIIMENGKITQEGVAGHIQKNNKSIYSSF